MRWLRRPAPDLEPRRPDERVESVASPLRSDDIHPPTTETALPLPFAIPFPDNTVAVTAGMGPRLDQVAAALLAALDDNPALTIHVAAYGEQPNAAAAGWRQSQDRLDSITAALLKRGIPAAIIQPELRVAGAPEFSTHSRADVLVQVVPRIVPVVRR